MSFNLSLSLSVFFYFYLTGWQHHWSNFSCCQAAATRHSSTITASKSTSADDVLMLLFQSVDEPPSCYCSCVLLFPAVSSARQTHTDRWLCFDCGLSVTLETHLTVLIYKKIFILLASSHLTSSYMHLLNSSLQNACSIISHSSTLQSNFSP